MFLFKNFTIFFIGFLSIGLQTLLFRDFFEVFEGSELGIGSFFTSWLIWVSFGAFIGSKIKESYTLKKYYSYLPLLYFPAYLFQKYLILYSREILAIKIYDLFPYYKMFFYAFLANSIVSFISGFIFSVSCSNKININYNPSHVYIIECFGSFIGGITITCFLANNIYSETIIFIFFILLIIPIFKRKRIILSTIIIIFIFLIFGIKIDKLWNRFNNTKLWNKFFKQSKYKGVIYTDKSKYLYGNFLNKKDQLNIYSNGSIIDIYPSVEKTSIITGITLANNPNASNIFIIGESALSLSQKFSRLDQISKITINHPDTIYQLKLFNILKKLYSIDDSKLILNNFDIRKYLNKNVENTQILKKELYDIIIINIDNPLDSSLNRYFTKEFYYLVSKSLNEDGIICVKFKGGENFLGPELINLGSSIYFTLKECFKNIILKPGEESFFICSNNKNITSNPEELFNNLTAIKGINNVFNPNRIKSHFNKHKIEFQFNKYLNNSKIINQDLIPITHLYSFLLNAKKQGTFIRMVLKIINEYGYISLILIAIIFCILRVIYLIKVKNASLINSFDIYSLIFLCGMTSISTEILLMFLFHTLFGSLYIFIGLLSSLFMLGLFFGSFLINYINNKIKDKFYERYALIIVLLFNILFLLNIFVCKVNLNKYYFIFLFLISGLINGFYFPLSSFVLQKLQLKNNKIGSYLEINDHLGGAVGGMITCIIFIPVIGVYKSIIIICLFLSTFIFILIFSKKSIKIKNIDIFQKRVRITGFILLGFTLFIFLNLTLKESLYKNEYKKQRTEETISDLYLVDSNEWGRKYISGYGGKIHLNILIDSLGIIKDLKILKHNETSIYYNTIIKLQSSLIGKKVFDKSFQKIDSVSGATYSSTAIRDTIYDSCNNYKKIKLDKNVEKVDQISKVNSSIQLLFLKYKEFYIFLLFLLISIFLRLKPISLIRKIFLFFVVLIFGVYLNLQYSFINIFLIKNISMNFINSPIAWFVIIIPIIIILFGNIYCGYLCPFGALQELLSNLMPEKFKIYITKDYLKWTRLIKYFLLILIIYISLFGFDLNYSTFDPLITFWNIIINKEFIPLVLIIMVLSFLFVRFWCRSFCFVGAFLSLFNEIKIFKFKKMRIIPNYCDLGVRSINDLDCIHCDRCKTTKSKEALKTNQKHNYFFLFIVILLFFYFCFLISNIFKDNSINELKMQSPKIKSTNQIYDQKETLNDNQLTQIDTKINLEQKVIKVDANTFIPSYGIPRNVNIRKMKRKIKRKKLSDKEAMFYK